MLNSQENNTNKLKKTVYLHIGMGKTGTSALQHFFQINFGRLAQQGILYPSAGAGQIKIAHHLFAASLWTKHPYWMPKTSTTPEQFFCNMLDEADSQCLNKILISSELLFFSPPEQINKLRTMLKNVRLVVICYIRRIDSFLPACLHQYIKAQSGTTDSAQFENVETVPFIKNIISGVSNCLKIWLDIFPKESLVIRPYEREQFVGSDIFSDFLDILCIKSKSVFDVPEKNFNPRLSRDALEYKRLLNRIHSDSPEKTTPFMSPLLSYSAREDISTTAAFNPDNNLLSPRIRYNAYKRNAEFYEYLAREYLNREDGRLFYDPLPDPNEPWQPYPGLRTEKAEKITQFLYDRRPDLVKSLCQRLSAVERESDEYIAEAQDILLPPLERVLARGELGKKSIS